MSKRTNYPLVEAYVDGGCHPNPGPGACAAIMFHKGRSKEFSRQFNQVVTNNEMEMQAAILALKQLKTQCEIHIYTDSQYLYKGMTVWIQQWKQNRWRLANNKPVANLELWLLLQKLAKEHEVYWHWVRGHNGNPYNERAHDLVQKTMGGLTEAARKQKLVDKRFDEHYKDWANWPWELQS